MLKIELAVSPALRELARTDDPLDGFNWGEMVPLITEAVERMFRTEGEGRWPALQPDSAAWKASRYPGTGILERTGAYLRAAVEPHSPYNVIEIEPDSITYGVEGLDYPQYHESPSPRPPQRAVFGLLATDSELIDDATQTLSDYIEHQFSRA